MLNSYRFLLILFIAILPWASYAQTIPIQHNENTLKLNQGIEYFVDKKGTLSIEEVLNQNKEFTPISFPFAAGFSQKVYWFRFTLENKNTRAKNWLLAIRPTFLDSVRLYQVNKDLSYSMAEVGDVLPAEQQIKPLSSPFSLPISLPNDEPHTFYIRLQTESLTQLDLTLRTPQAEAHADAKSKLLFGIAIGAWLLLCLYSIIMSWLVKRKVYLISCVYLLGSILNCLVTSGILATYIFPNHPSLVNLFSPGSVCLILSGIILFFINFFDTRKRFKYIHWILIAELLLIAITFISIFTNKFSFFAPLMHNFSHFVFFIIFYICWKGIGMKIPGSRSLFIGQILFLTINFFEKIGINQEDSIFHFFSNMQEVTSYITSFIFIIIMYHGLNEYNKKITHDKIALSNQIDKANQATALEKQRRIDQSNFMSLVTHELKTPITIIDSVLQTLKIEKIEVSPELSDRHSIIKNSIEELNSLINKTLIAENLESKPFSVIYKEINLHDFIKKSISKTAIQQYEFEIDISKDHLINVDPDLFFLLVSNLLVNAKKYKTTDSKIAISVRESLKSDKQGTSILFSNYFESQEKPNTDIWFKKYHRQMDTPNIQGFGLGLYLVKAVIEAHSGHIECHVEKEGDLWEVTFDLWFPSPKKDQELTAS